MLRLIELVERCSSSCLLTLTLTEDGVSTGLTV